MLSLRIVCIGVAYLKQAIQDLPANIFLVCREQLRVQKLVDVSRKVVLGQQIFHFTYTASAFHILSSLSCAEDRFGITSSP